MRVRRLTKEGLPNTFVMEKVIAKRNKKKARENARLVARGRL